MKDIVGNKDAVDRLQVISEEGNMPNIILAVRHSPKSQPSEIEHAPYWSLRL